MFNKLALSVVSAVLVALLVGSGYVAGRYQAGRELGDFIAAHRAAESLGGLLEEGEAEAAAAAYSDPDRALAAFDEVSWSVPNVPTPFVGTAPLPGRHQNATINSLQFRGAPELRMPKPAGTYRIFLTGGSTAYGSGALTEDGTLAARLEALLQAGLGPGSTPDSGSDSDLDFEVTTAANPAWSSTHERILIENRLSELDPDLVISLSGANDVHWGRARRNVLFFHTYADEYFLGLVDRAYRLAGEEPLPRVAVPGDEPVPPPLVAARLAKNADLAAYALARAQSPYLFALQPVLQVTGKPLTERERGRLGNDPGYYAGCYRELRTALAELQTSGRLDYVDLSTLFDSLGEEEVFLDSYHFGDHGTALVARGLYGAARRVIEAARGSAPPP